LAANSIFLTGVGAEAAVVVVTRSSSSVVGAEYAGNVGRTGGMPPVSFGGSLLAGTLGGIRGGICHSASTDHCNAE